jgi:hypothetical protein
MGKIGCEQIDWSDERIETRFRALPQNPAPD